jgi:hypothetical protein
MSYHAEVVLATRHKTVADTLLRKGEAPTAYTFKLRYPRIIHAEMMTHRIHGTQPAWEYDLPLGLMYDSDLSRNTSSSRAIPTPRLLQDVVDWPYEPWYWGKNQSGMAAAEELGPFERETAIQIWRDHRKASIDAAMKLHHLGAHKQLANRLIEVHGWITVVMTTTNLTNFLVLREDAGAMPEIRRLAEMVRAASDTASIQDLAPGEWHLPFIDRDVDVDLLPSRPKNWQPAATIFIENTRYMDAAWFDECLRKVSVARCARTSYLSNVTGKRSTLAEDIELHDKLLKFLPIHASPAEHQLTPDRFDLIAADAEMGSVMFHRPSLHGNMNGFIQYRKLIPNECQ